MATMGAALFLVVGVGVVSGVGAFQPPCECGGSVLNCSRRLFTPGFDFAGACEGEVTTLDLSDTPLASFPDGLGDHFTDIRAAKCRLCKMPQVAAKTEVLILNGNSIEEVGDELKDLENLRVLDVAFNSLKSLSFLPSPSCSLEKLDASYNRLSSLDGLNACTKLQWLALGWNPSLPLDPDVFSGLDELRRLDLSNIGLQKVPSEVLERLPQLEELILNRNRLLELPAGSLSIAPRLRSFQLQGAECATVALDAFPADIEEIELVRNSIGSFPAHLSELQSLRKLDLSYNRIEEIQSGALSGFKQLEWLSLQSNKKLTGLDSSSFSELSNLKHLDLGSTSISSFPSDLFTNTPQLTHLFLMDTSIETFPSDGFSTLKKLEVLDISWNKINEITKEMLQGLENLKYLDVGGMKINEFPKGLFEELPKLEYLSLTSSKLKQYPENLFEGLQNIKTIDLSRNKIKSLPQDFLKGLKTLENFYAKSIKVNKILPQFFSNIKNIKTIQLQSTSLSEIPDDAYPEDSTLEELDLSKNWQLSSVPHAPMPCLRRLLMEEGGWSSPTGIPPYDPEAWPRLEEADFSPMEQTIPDAQVALSSWLEAPALGRARRTLTVRYGVEGPKDMRWAVDHPELQILDPPPRQKCRAIVANVSAGAVVDIHFKKCVSDWGEGLDWVQAARDAS